jgi:hypothetical protein
VAAWALKEEGEAKKNLAWEKWWERVGRGDRERIAISKWVLADAKDRVKWLVEVD